ncbi:hypothetical protein JRO89_XS12G0018000 [Xanthoceras sorbifolium]|uniref:CCHC-type domain-containing protein n=1 Tax=Xanthoceras sorbifolium TaxID=99658 RepID=A0ABQ8HAG1_9ROSI|nr:hypothetical protein JRO89_XS12G0018000 [Xanthoceras sorbifolium]
MAPTNSLREFAVDFVKLNSFDSGNFIRWQKKLHFLLSMLNVVYVLTTPKPVKHDDEIVAQIRERHKWEQDDYICIGLICNAIYDAMLIHPLRYFMRWRKEKRLSTINTERKFELKKNQNSNKKHKGVCHHCGKPGHFKRDCCLLKKKNEENSSKFVAMKSEINALEDDTTWWIY